ncbi:hypothetical protein [Idiomarina piscisalsi]|uniref:hypothetical protein n=1 Tax=Idiomarina piscisalsi TaxID=1096243 RepID=UPI00137DE447|nr:hypothetical protein [Idiomarina piscisalsi]MTJ00900.1 hypothetical protein [Idiomarina piscisalsi]
MIASVTKALRFWAILFLVVCALCAAAAYFFTKHQSQKLQRLLSENAQQLAAPVPTVSETLNPLLPSSPVDELLSTVAQRYPVKLHYQHTDPSNEGWLVTVEAEPQQAMRFVAEVVAAQYKKLSHFPETDSLFWEAIETKNTDAYGVLKWQFRWQTEATNEPLNKPIHANHFTPVHVPALSCHEKPFQGARPPLSFSEETIGEEITNEQSKVVLTAIQTHPTRKAIFKTKNNQWITTREGDWLGSWTQIDIINTDSLNLSQWKQSGNCWQKHSQQLRINKESDAT